MVMEPDGASRDNYAVGFNLKYAEGLKILMDLNIVCESNGISMW